MSNRYACGYVIRFVDGGEPEEQILHIGTLEECERVCKLLPAVAYSGARPVAGAEMVVVKIPEEGGNG